MNNSDFTLFFSTLYDAGDIVEIRAIWPNRQGPAPRSQWHSAADWLAGADHDWVERMNRDGWGIYAGVLPRTAAGVRGNVNTLPGALLWADIDHVTPAEAGEWLGKSGLPHPSVTINSGHGVQCYWLLTAPQPPKTLQAANQDIALHLGSDIVVKNPERVMRIPGFVNHKPPVADAEMLECHADLRYDFDELRAKIPAAKLPPAPAPAMAARSFAFSDKNAEKRAWGMIQTKQGSLEGGRNWATYKAAAVLTRDFALDDDTAMAMIVQWNAEKNSPPIANMKELGGIIVHSRLYGRNPMGHMLAENRPSGLADKDDGFDVDAFVQAVAAEPMEPEIRELPSFEPAIQKLFSTPGFCADYMTYCKEYANKYQPILAMGGMLALGSTLIARRLTSATGAMSNIYVLPIATSTAGKDFPRKLSMTVLNKAGMSKYHAETVKTSSALVSSLYIHPVLLIQPDEFGKKMQMAKASNGAPAAFGIELNTLYLELYTSSGGIYAIPRIAEDIRDFKKAKIRGEAVDAPAMTIDKPHLIIYGATTPKTFYENITTESIADGLLGRMLILDVDGYHPKRRYIPETPPEPESLIEDARWWSNFNAEKGWDGSMTIRPTVVPITDEAMKIAKNFIDIEYEEMKAMGDSPLAPLWGRAGQIADKISLIYASLRDKNNIIIDAEACSFGYDLITIALKRTIITIGENVAENKFDEMRLQMLRIIREHGGRIEHWRLVRKFKHGPIDFQQVLSVLKDSGHIRFSA